MTKEGHFYVTTPIYYPSGKPHIGHVYTTISADIIARWNRNIKKDVFFQTGTDEHGQKMVEKSKEANEDISVYATTMSKLFENLSEKFHLSNDYFIRTTFDEHKEIVQLMLQRAYDNGDIYKATYNGLYCVGCEKYYTGKELDENKNCPIHLKPCIEMEDENYFFRLSKYQDRLLELYENNTQFLSPTNKASEIINRVKEGLQDISISRHIDKLDWGVEFPFDKEHVTYVWFDALFNYFSSTKYLDKPEFWPCDVHIIGHDISWFHTVYWPAFLISVGEDVPLKVFSHGLIVDENGHKMSKSLGNVVDPYECAEKFGVDELRYYLFSAGTFGEDLKFSYKTFAEKINNELNNDLGNLVSRVHAMTHKYFQGTVPQAQELKDVDKKLITELNFFDEFNKDMQNLSYNQAIEVLWKRIRATNAYINEVSPWKEADENRLKTIINILVSATRLFAEYLDCFMPTKAQRIFAQLNCKKEGNFTFTQIKANHTLGEKDNIFQKIKLEEKKEEPEKKEGFESLKLIVGKIVEIGDHPQADKLFKLKIDIGEEQPRQILTGLKEHYTHENIDKGNVIIIANLKPAKMRGELSEGMMLAAEDEKGVGVLRTDADVGTILEWNGQKANNGKIIKTDAFFKVKMESQGDKIVHEGKEVIVNNKSIIVDKKITGVVH